MISLEELDKCFDLLFPHAKKYEIYQFISGIYCLGKIEFSCELNGNRVVGSEHPLRMASRLLSLDEIELTDALTNRVLHVSGENGEKIR